MREGLREPVALEKVAAGIENFRELAAQLVHADEDSPESGEMHELAKRIDYLARQQDRVVDRVLLRAMILLIPWPDYDEGDGYWSAPSTAATKIALDARELSL